MDTEDSINALIVLHGIDYMTHEWDCYYWKGYIYLNRN